MISGAVYRDGIARTADGAVYITSAAPTAASTPCHGSALSPAGLLVDADGVIHVRFV
jgi:hypothetical protein